MLRSTLEGGHTRNVGFDDSHHRIWTNVNTAISHQRTLNLHGAIQTLFVLAFVTLLMPIWPYKK